MHFASGEGRVRRKIFKGNAERLLEIRIHLTIKAVEVVEKIFGGGFCQRTKLSAVE